MANQELFREGNLSSTPIRDLGLAISGKPLEPVLHEFLIELEKLGIHRLRPHFYLSTEWGVNFGTIAIAIPFYLAKPELTAIHAERIGHVEGADPTNLLRYLRHEMGHVVNYAYKLHEDKEWINKFGSMSLPYEDDYRPEPFSPRFVHHLPGWYAQKHPDEDWAETFAVWMTPGFDWRAAYADSPEALSKLVYCDHTMADLNNRDPEVTSVEMDEDVGQLSYSVDEFYDTMAVTEDVKVPSSLDSALRTVFEGLEPHGNVNGAPTLPASELIRRVDKELVANVYHWTSHSTDRIRALLRHLAARAEQLHLEYRAEQETAVLIALTSLVTGLAMNFVLRGSYFHQ